MLIQKKHFKWDDSKNEYLVKLRQSKDDLIAAGLVNELPNNDDPNPQYTGVNGFPSKIIFKDDVVEQIWFDYQNEFWYGGINLKEKAMNEGVSCLWDCFEEIGGDTLSIDTYQGGDILYVILSDGFIRMMALIARA